MPCWWHLETEVNAYVTWLSVCKSGDGQRSHPALVRPGRMWITNYPSASLEKARAVYSPSELSGMEAGVVALYQKCPHLGCRVPSCVTSQWFECPCHGSQYDTAARIRKGPAPKNLYLPPYKFLSDTRIKVG